MGNAQGLPDEDMTGKKGKGDDKKDDNKDKQARGPAPITHGRRKRKSKGTAGTVRMPTVTPSSRCALRKLRLERIKDYLLLEEEYVSNQKDISANAKDKHQVNRR